MKKEEYNKKSIKNNYIIYEYSNKVIIYINRKNKTTLNDEIYDDLNKYQYKDILYYINEKSINNETVIIKKKMKRENFIKKKKNKRNIIIQ